MGPDAVARIREVFARQRAVTLPIGRLHELLADDTGERAPGLAELESYVRRRSDAFVVFDPAPQRFAHISAVLPAGERESFARALAALTAATPRVACIDADPQEYADGCAGALRGTMVQLCRLAAADPRLREAMAEAVAEGDTLAAALRG